MTSEHEEIVDMNMNEAATAPQMNSREQMSKKSETKMDKKGPVYDHLNMTNVGDDFLEPALQPVGL